MVCCCVLFCVVSCVFACVADYVCCIFRNCRFCLCVAAVLRLFCRACVLFGLWCVFPLCFGVCLMLLCS